MYRKSLQSHGLGIERHSSMPEMTRDEFLEKREQETRPGIRRNNSFTSATTTSPKKRIIKTKVSSRLLQATASTQRKQKDTIAYVPPAKRADPIWTDRPMKNVESGYTTQTFVKTYDEEKRRNIVNSYNYIHDHKEKIEWGKASQSSDSSCDLIANGLHSAVVANGLHSAVSGNKVNRPPLADFQSSSNGYECIESMQTDFKSTSNSNIEILDASDKGNISSHQSLLTDALYGRKILGDSKLFVDSKDKNEPDKKNKETNWSKYDHGVDINYEPFTTFSKQSTVFAAKTTAPHESKTFQYIYSIESELSYREYNKLMSIINMLQEQKKKWEYEVQEVRDKLEKTGKEKMQLAHNNHILRQSLEAANKAIKEINEKVQELKQTLMPLREDNSKLRKVNVELEQHIEVIKNENITYLNEIREFKNMKIIYEETIGNKENQLDEYRQNMHEKFRKLEEAYRIYRDDMEQTHLVLNKELDQSRKGNDNMKRELEILKKENATLKKDIDKILKKNNELENDLQKRKSVNDQLVKADKEKKMLSVNVQEIEKVYMREAEESKKEINYIRKEIENYKDETRELESENNQLKFDLENLENITKDFENDREIKERERKIENQHNEMLRNEVEELKKELNGVEQIKKERAKVNEENEKYRSQLEVLQRKLIEFENLKREIGVSQHENEKQKCELQNYKNELKAMDSIKKDRDSGISDNERLNTELQHLRQQLSLLEDKQKYITSPYNDEIKLELENIRNEMKDLADLNHQRKTELNSVELKGELESIRSQIKDLDNSNRKYSPPLQQHSVLIQDSSSTVVVSEKERMFQQVIYVKDGNGNFRECKKSDSDEKQQNKQQPDEKETGYPNKELIEETTSTIVEKAQLGAAMPFYEGNIKQEETKEQKEINQDIIDSITMAHEQNFNSSTDTSLKERRSSTGALKAPFVLKSTEISRREREKPDQRRSIDANLGDIRKNRNNCITKDLSQSDGEYIRREQDEEGREGITNKRKEEEEKRRKDKQIQDRIKRKREQATPWSLKTPSIEILQRKSIEEGMDAYGLYQQNNTERSRSHSANRQSIRARSIDSINQSKHIRRERGRSPHRHDREYVESNERYDRHDENKNERNIRNNTANKHVQRYTKTEEKAADKLLSLERKTEIERLKYGNHESKSRTQTSTEQQTEYLQNKRRRVKSEDRKRRQRNYDYNDADDSSSEIEDRRRYRSRNQATSPQTEVLSPDLLADAMKSRQEQAINTKLNNTRAMTFRESDENRKNQLTKAYQQQQQLLHQQQQVKSTHVETTSNIEKRHTSTMVNTVHRSHTMQTAPVKPQRMLDTDRGYVTDSPRIARANAVMVKTAGISSSQKQVNVPSDRQVDLLINERVAGSSTNQHVKNVRSDQAIKLTLKPTTKNQESLYANLDKSISSHSQKGMSRVELEEVKRMEKARQKVLLKNAQAAVKREVSITDKETQDTKKTIKTTEHKRQASMRDVITIDGVAVDRNKSTIDGVAVDRSRLTQDTRNGEQNNGGRGRNTLSQSTEYKSSQSNEVSTKANSIFEPEANTIHNQHAKQNASSTKANMVHAIQSNNTHVSSSDKVRTHMVSRRHSEERRPLDKMNGQQMNFQTNTLPPKLKPLQGSINFKSHSHHHSDGMLVQENLQNRSYRGMKLSEDIRRKQKSSNKHDAISRLSVLSDDSLGGFSQITYATVSDENYNPRYDDYATQIDGDIESRQGGIPQSFSVSQQSKKHHTLETYGEQSNRRETHSQRNEERETYDVRDILKHAKYIPKGHSKFSCEKCRDLNIMKTKEQPLIFCWERYYPISQTTPRQSLISL